MESKNKKKVFPKVRKDFQKFLTDESGKVTKKWALGISAGAALLGAFDADAAQYHYNGSTDVSHASHASHNNGSTRDGHTNASSHGNTTYGNFWNMIVDYTPGEGCTVNHGSGIVNGHANANPGAVWSPTVINGISGHGSHVSHSNHGSWGWC